MTQKGVNGRAEGVFKGVLVLGFTYATIFTSDLKRCVNYINLLSRAAQHSQSVVDFLVNCSFDP